MNQVETDGLKSAPAVPGRLSFGSGEWAGAFCDLGTLVPFLLAYVTVVGIAPSGMLLGFGLALVATGLYYGTPQAVQPMKAIGAVSIAGAAQTATVTPEAVAVAALATGIIWLSLGLTGTAERVIRWIGRPVIIGITLGLRLAIMLRGTQLMATAIWFAAPLLLLTILLLVRKAIFAMALILVSGFAWAMLSDSSMTNVLTATRPGFVPPAWPFGHVSLEAVITGVLMLALPQVPLTLGNAVLAPVEYSNREFPQRPVTERQLAVSTGLMNTLGSFIGAVPMCHGAGEHGGADQFRRAQRRCTSDSGRDADHARAFFQRIAGRAAAAVSAAGAGVMLFLAGAQLALGSCDFARDKGERFVTLGTAALAIWNVGVAFLFGIVMLSIARRGWLRL